MATNRTFTMIKPDAVEKGYIGGILNMINEGGFKIVAMKYTQLSKRVLRHFMQYTKSVHSLENWLNHDTWTDRSCYS